MSGLRPWLRQVVAVTPGRPPWRRMLLIGLSVAIAEAISALAWGSVDAAFAAFAVYYAYSLDFGGPLRHRTPTVLFGLATIVACGVVGHALAGNHIGRTIAVFALAAFGGAIYSVGPRVLQIVRFGIVALLVATVFPQLSWSRLPPLMLGGFATLAVAWVQQALFGPERRLQPGGLTRETRRLSSTMTPDVRFALCYGAVAALGLVVGQVLLLPRPYWVSVTSVFAMQPESAQTGVRMSQRVAGTLLAVPVTIAALSVGQHPALLMVVIALSAFAVPFATARNYLFGSASVVVFVIAALNLVYLQQGGALNLLRLRFEETVIGAVLAMAGMAITYGFPAKPHRLRPSLPAQGG
jgi:hypothetical protein